MSFVVGGRPARALVLGTGACALLAVLLSVLLPLAPVRVNEPTVHWPVDPSAPTSTLLSLTSYRPVQLDLRFSCRAARATAAYDHTATVLATMNPLLPEVANLGLITRVSGGELTVDAVGRRLVQERLPAGECHYRVHGDPTAGLTLTRDGIELGRGPAGVLPDVDMLATSLAALPDATTDDLGVVLKVDDEFAATPTGFKRLLTALLVLALVGVGAGLWKLDRAVPRVPEVRRPPIPHPADAAVLLAMVCWLLLAPSTDDDGYYAAMAANSRQTGFVGNFYQLYDQSFTPITWFYQVLSWWQTVAGTAPVAQRMLALAAGVLTWFAVRAFVSSALRHCEFPSSGRLVRMLAPVVAGVAFLAWWLPLNMGVRPESAVALLTVCGLLGVWVAVRRQRLLFAFAACAAAGLSLATHTTGFVGLAPLLAGMGGLWSLVRVPGQPDRTLARTLAVISGGTTAALAGFADGSLRDFLRAQQIFLDIQHREYWYTEYLRWQFLLGDGPMGNYAKRAAVLVTLVALLWFLVLGAASRGRGERLPAALRLAGWSLIAGFGLLWLTPSKWTHHFGALAGIGPVFLTLLLVAAVPLARAVFRDARPPLPVQAAAAGSVLIALTLAGHGRNSWPYAWLPGFADVNKPPDVGPFTFGSALSWVVVLLGCVAAGWLWGRRRSSGTGTGADTATDTAVDLERWRPAVLPGVVLFVVAGLLLNVGYLLGSFALSARNTAHSSWSLWGANVSDLGARRCGAADAVSVYDPFSARPLSEVVGLDSAGPGPGPEDDTGTEDTADADSAGTNSPTGPQRQTQRPTQRASRTDDGATGFEPAGGYYVGYQPPVQIGTGAATTIWGSLVPSKGRTPDRTTGEMRTPWYRLPAGLAPDQAIAVLVAGSPNQGNTLTAEYGTIEGDRVIKIDPSLLDTGLLDNIEAGTSALDDNARDPRWRSIQLEPPATARLVRLHAVDNSAGAGGWLAFAAPAVQRLKPLLTVLRSAVGPAPGAPAGVQPVADRPVEDRPVALAWQIAFQYPCLRQPRIRDGITEPPAAAVLWADQPFAGTRDATWLPFRGGVYGQVLRSQSALQLTARVRGMPAERRMEVLVFDTRLASDAYLLTTRERRSTGWAQPVPTPTRTSNELERCVQDAAAKSDPAAALRCAPKPVP